MHCSIDEKEENKGKTPKTVSENFPAFSLSRQYHLGKGLDIN
jgi:hypothetical protein